MIISDYNLAHGLSLVLADYSGIVTRFLDNFTNATINIIGLDGGLLSFDTSLFQLKLKVNGPPGTLILIN